MIQKLIRFLTRPPGVILPLIAAALLVGWYFNERRAKTQSTSPGVQRELGAVKPGATVPADQVPQEVVVQNKKVVPIQSMEQSAPTPKSTAIGNAPAPAAQLPTLVNFYVTCRNTDPGTTPDAEEEAADLVAARDLHSVRVGQHNRVESYRYAGCGRSASGCVRS